MKQFVKALTHDKPPFLYLKNKFPKISDAEVIESISVGTQIRELMHDNEFQAAMNETESAAWCACKGVCI